MTAAVGWEAPQRNETPSGDSLAVRVPSSPCLMTQRKSACLREIENCRSSARGADGCSGEISAPQRARDADTGNAHYEIRRLIGGVPRALRWARVFGPEPLGRPPHLRLCEERPLNRQEATRRT